MSISMCMRFAMLVAILILIYTWVLRVVCFSSDRQCESLLCGNGQWQDSPRISFLMFSNALWGTGRRYNHDIRDGSFDDFSSDMFDKIIHKRIRRIKSFQSREHTSAPRTFGIAHCCSSSWSTYRHFRNFILCIKLRVSDCSCLFPSFRLWTLCFIYGKTKRVFTRIFA